MARKPDIQYIGQFYVYGSEARALELQKKKKAGTNLPLERLRQVQKIYVDPVAIIGIAVSVVMLVVMVLGAVQIHNAWEEYEDISAYHGELERENAVLEHGYRTGFDLEDIRTKAIALGMVPPEEAQTMDGWVTLPVEEPEPTWWENILWFLEGLLE